MTYRNGAHRCENQDDVEDYLMAVEALIRAGANVNAKSALVSVGRPAALTVVWHRIDRRHAAASRGNARERGGD
jgi:hypothetical protein